MVQDRRAYGIDGSNHPAFCSVGQWVEPLANGSKTGWFGTARIQRLRLDTQGGIIPSLVSRFILGRQSDFQSSDPDEYAPELSNSEDFKSDIIQHCFTPSAASVLTISAPQMLLSGSLAMPLIALGIYFGFLWTRSLDQNAGPNDSRNVFITYLTGLAVSGLVYNISQLFQDGEKRSERQIVQGYLKEYVTGQPNAVSRWGVDAQLINGVLSLTPRASGNRTEHVTETLTL
jgi:hypothetical protein